MSLPAIERPPVAVELFRSSHTQTDSQPDEEAEKQGANWIKWILIAAGPMVLGLMLLVVFTRPSSQTPRREAEATSAPVQSQPETVVAPAANPSSKPIAGTRSQSRRRSDGADPGRTESAASEPVSPDAMAAQLVAPTRIAGQSRSSTADRRAASSSAGTGGDGRK